MTFSSAEKTAALQNVDAQGRKHREDGPSISNSVGDEIWFWHGEFHREDGPAVVWVNDTECWYHHGLQHRIGGPAVTHFSGKKEWWVNGKQHRTDGPAVENVNSSNEWWFNGKKLFAQTIKELTKRYLSEEDAILCCAAYPNLTPGTIKQRANLTPDENASEHQLAAWRMLGAFI